MSSETDVERSSIRDFDAVVVGAGFAGLYMLHRLRESGLSVHAFEQGAGVGGTWYWNRYPGARCDVESFNYSYSFSPELEQEWEWTERYPTQPELLRYLNHVADRFDLRTDITLETSVVSAIFDEASALWEITTDRGDRLRTRYCIMATGCLSAAVTPSIPGLETFRGTTHHTAAWPLAGTDLRGRRVGVIGTGSSGVQVIPMLAAEAAELLVFQRTANYTMPAFNRPLDPEEIRLVKADYRERRQRIRQSPNGTLRMYSTRRALDVTSEERSRVYEDRWQGGGAEIVASFSDLLMDEVANETAADFVRAKIRKLVAAPDVAEMLSPRGLPIGAKRPCVGTDYYETFNRANVTLVDVSADPIEAITETGLRTRNAEYQLDTIVFATGFDAFTGALKRIDIRGRAGIKLADHWADGPKAYLGLAVSGFPNLFILTGPGSPSVLGNMVVSIEQHVEWVADLLNYLRARSLRSVEALPEAEREWAVSVAKIAEGSLLSKAKSWFVGANVPGKPRVFMMYAGGFVSYREKCDDVAAKDYDGFVMT